MASMPERLISQHAAPPSLQTQPTSCTGASRDQRNRPHLLFHVLASESPVRAGGLCAAPSNRHAAGEQREGWVLTEIK